MRVFKNIKICNFHPFEIEGRGSESQLQVGKKLNSVKKTQGEGKRDVWSLISLTLAQVY